MKITHDKASVKKVLEELKRTTDSVTTHEELEKALLSGKQLRMKYGVDVTAPTLHIGHAVNLWMYRKLQDLGHRLIFLIGDFTTQIGDPTGRDKRRPIIPEAEIKKNAKEFIKQATMVLRKDRTVFEIRKNSEWFGKMKARDILGLMSQVTHDKLISRDMFQKRMEEKKEIYMHEMVYPLLQGYDSVELESDLTIIGSDQLFNEMMGRFYQQKSGQAPQIILTSKITPGLDGGPKQSKSLGNYVGLQHSPREKFGKVMTLIDSLIPQYLEVYTDLPMDEVKEVADMAKTDPLTAKKILAFEIVARYHGSKIAHEEQEWFEKTFSKKETPSDAPKIQMKKSESTILEILHTCFKNTKSGSELRRLIQQSSVKVNDEVVKDAQQKISLSSEPLTLKVGKRNWFLVTK